jgi:hypothetical protein
MRCDFFKIDLKLILDEINESGPDICMSPRLEPWVLIPNASFSVYLKISRVDGIDATSQVELRYHEMIEIADGPDLFALVIGQIKREDLFCS